MDSDSSDHEAPSFRDPILATEPEATVCDEAGLARVLEEISYGKPNKLERYPWLERLDYVAKTCLPVDLDANADIEREKLLFENTLAATKQALLKLKYLGVKFARPKDFMAEMIKSDEHMLKLRSRVEAQKIRIEKSAVRRHNKVQKSDKRRKRKQK
eukprot:Gregarina_sp_Poly_1__4247@NODE_2314_length_2309_cov_55_248885_g1481_i0_p3_GENE_NODE_2314_length_2309_cov_55_248885_g1481_i0NODE_2314_length_2309_cov_55_248885_g1481_i0_p3_ORF_typecomplete_len157_score22_56Ebp2/PF05890_12/1_5e32DOR/PF14839_6/0_15_NODE_2314_length_2309_cov_55_248885_g1481_i013051775